MTYVEHVCKCGHPVDTHDDTPESGHPCIVAFLSRGEITCGCVKWQRGVARGSEYVQVMAGLSKERREATERAFAAVLALAHTAALCEQAYPALDDATADAVYDLQKALRPLAHSLLHIAERLLFDHPGEEWRVGWALEWFEKDAAEAEAAVDAIMTTLHEAAGG